MKRFCYRIALVVALAFPILGFSQGLFVKVGGGFGYGVSPEEVGTIVNGDTTGDFSNGNKYFTFGTGGKGGIDVGYMFTKYLGLQLGGEFFQGTRFVAGEVNGLTNVLGTTNSTVYSQNTMLRGKLALVVQGGPDRFKFYGRLGVVIPVWGFTTTRTETTFSPAGGGPTVSNLEVARNFGKFSVGYNGVFGFKFKFTKLISIFGELEVMHLRIRAKQTKVIKYENDGVDALDTRTLAETQTDYQEVLDKDSNNIGFGSIDPDRPLNELVYTTPNSQAAINVGIMFTFGRNKD